VTPASTLAGVCWAVAALIFAIGLIAVVLAIRGL
jgi:hypothetical protein